jgi:hypothetical protein
MNMMLAAAMTGREEARFYELEPLISEELHSQGLSVRICRGEGDGESRQFTFIDGKGNVTATLSATVLMDGALSDILTEIRR